MTERTQEVLRSALLRLLRPLCRVMLRHGLAYGSFAEIARKAFVDESLAGLRRAGKRPTISAVAAETGLTRKEARRLLDFDVTAAVDNDARYNRAVRVITAWAVDPRFLDDDGQPRVLPPDGEDSFATLVRDYSGDITPASMLATLESSGSLHTGADGLHLISRAYLPTQTPEASLNILGNDVFELLSTIDHNLTHPKAARVFQRKVSNATVRIDAISEFRALSQEKSQALLEEYDAWLSEHETVTSEDEAARYVAVGIYYFDNTLNEEPDS